MNKKNLTQSKTKQDTSKVVHTKITEKNWKKFVTGDDLTDDDLILRAEVRIKGYQREIKKQRDIIKKIKYAMPKL